MRSRTMPGSGTRFTRRRIWTRPSSTSRAAFRTTSFSHSMLAQSKLLPDGALGILEELAASDKCMLGALNNEARETNEYRFEHFGCASIFKVAFSSCYLGLRKPEPAIYQRALDILGTAAGADSVYRRSAGECGGRSRQWG